MSNLSKSLNISDQGSEDILNSTMNEVVNGKSILNIDISVEKIDMIDKNYFAIKSADQIIKEWEEYFLAKYGDARESISENISEKKIISICKEWDSKYVDVEEIDECEKTIENNISQIIREYGDAQLNVLKSHLLK